MAPTHPLIPIRRQTTLLVGGSNGTKTLSAILGDPSNPLNAGHIVRVATRSPDRFLDDDDPDKPAQWRCNEQKPFTDLVPSDLLPTSWTTHVGAPDSVFGYTDDPEDDALERAISGSGAHDDGGVADVVLLCCPVAAHLPILRRLARALYKLDANRSLLTSPAAPPLLVGTLYAAGGFDWMARIAFATEKPSTFDGVWNRELALFGMKSFPYLCKSTQKGTVNLYGRYPQLTAAVCPSTPRVRRRAKAVLERVLQTADTGKTLSFLGISSSEDLGGDGSATVVDAAALALVTEAAAKASSSSRKEPSGGGAGGGIRFAAPGGPPGGGIRSTDDLPLSDAASRPMADHADPFSSLGFLSCTLNATNQILHPCIIAGLFHDPSDPEASDANGTIPWNAEEEKTPLPRFYADGAAKPESSRLITAIAGAELYPLMDCLDVILAPSGMIPVSSQHGGEPVGRWLCNFAGNSPREVAERSGLTDMVLRKQQSLASGDDASEGAGTAGGGKDEKEALEGAVPRDRRMNRRRFFEWAMRYGLSHNTRLGYVLSPALHLRDEETGKPLHKIVPNVKTRFFIDDIPHGLCIALGLGEMLGFNLERDMPETLGLVRRLQRWMGKEYVIPADSETAKGGRRVVSDARDLSESSAPQSFGVKTIEDLRNFLRMSPFGEDVQRRMESTIERSALGGKLVPAEVIPSRL